VDSELDAEAAEFLRPARVFSREEVLTRPSPVPAANGVYGWWFRSVPPLIDASRCTRRSGLALLYVGISPREPPADGGPASGQNLRKRLRQHYARTAEASTLRRTLGCLLAGDLGLELRRVGSTGRRTTFAAGERILSDWMADNAFVNWVVQDQPWRLEEELIRRLELPLNLRGNAGSRSLALVTQARARCLIHARNLPVLPR